MYPGQKSGNDYFRYILDTYSDQIIRLCYTYTHNMTDAEDLTEDTFCELVRTMPSFDSTEHEQAWLFKVAVNKCRNHAKSARVRMTVPDDRIAEDVPAPETKFYDGENERVRKAVFELPEKYRTVIHLYYFEDIPIEKIAKICGLPKATVGTRLSRGRGLLKEKLGGEFDA